MSEKLEEPTRIEKRNSPPTIQDVAAALGMHKSTVSVALSGKGTLSERTRNHIRTVAREMGYEPNPLAQRLASGNANQAVCLVSSGLDMGLGTEKLLLIQQELIKRELDVPIYACSEPATKASRSQAEQVRQICRERPRAVICGSQIIGPGVIEELEAYRNTGGIVVTYDTPSPLAVDQVIFDREDNAYQAATHVLSKGHRKVGLAVSDKVGWVSNSNLVSQPARIRGFQRAMEQYGAEVRPEWIFHLGTYERGGEELARQFFALAERPTAMCIVNDYVALAFMVEAMRKGLSLPRDLSIVGHDNQPIAVYCPVPLTSATQPAEQIAHEAVKLVLARLEGSTDPPQTKVVTGALAVRESVADIL